MTTILPMTHLQCCASAFRANAFLPLPYAVVLNPGTDQEALLGNFSTHRAALTYIERQFNDDNCHQVEVMKWTPDYTLTTEL